MLFPSRSKAARRTLAMTFDRPGSARGNWPSPQTGLSDGRGETNRRRKTRYVTCTVIGQRARLTISVTDGLGSAIVRGMVRRSRYNRSARHGRTGKFDAFSTRVRRRSSCQCGLPGGTSAICAIIQGL